MVKHAEASTVTVLISVGRKTVCIDVVDDGIGFDLPACREGFGLSYIRQRVAFLGGVMSIVTAPKKGTRVSIEIPLSS
jgi:signal transduction histidine kinase